MNNDSKEGGVLNSHYLAIIMILNFFNIKINSEKIK